MKKLLLVSMVVALAFTLSGCDLGFLPASQTRTAMGTQVTITAYEKSPTLSFKFIDAVIDSAFQEIFRIEKLTRYEQLYDLNSAAGYEENVVTGKELNKLIIRAYGLNEASEGRYCPYLEPAIRLWGFDSDRAVKRVPELWEVDSVLAIMDSTYFTQVNDTLARLTPQGAGLDLSGFAKGYAVDRACYVLQSLGITAGIVEAGGDLRCFGTKPNGKPWQIGVRHPRNLDSLFTTIELDSGAVATSGDYENYFEVDGRYYHHLLDPITGQPSYRSASATVVAASCADADAWATAFFVLGPENGVTMAQRYNLDALIIRDIGGDITSNETRGMKRMRLDEDEE